MGCGPSNSQIAPGDDVSSKVPKANGHAVASEQNRSKSISNGVNHSKPTNQSKNNPLSKPKLGDINEQAKKGIAFDITFGEDHPLKKPPPRRFQQLMPLNLPTLSAAQLEEKQKQADKKREQLMKKRVKSASKASRRRRELIAAREFSQQQVAEDIETSQRTADQKREAHLREVKEKQRKREEKARRARERARRIKEAEQEGLSIDVERDMTYNTDDGHRERDSWLEGDTPAQRGAGDSRVRSPDKRGRAHSQQRTPRLDSASTIDSCDAAFTRQKPRQPDDFFDS